MFPKPKRVDHLDVYLPREWETPGGRSRDAVYRDFGKHLGGTADVVSQHRALFVPMLQVASTATGGLPVVDVGCGRGELLALLETAGTPCIGVEMSAIQSQRLRDAGHQVVEADGNAYLESVPDGSLAAVTCFNVLEHTDPDYALRFVELVGLKVAPGGAAVIHTSNPESPFEMGVFWADPTHVRPYHPQTIGFLMAQAGFKEVRIRYAEPAPIEFTVSGDDSGIFRCYSVIGMRAGGEHPEPQ